MMRSPSIPNVPLDDVPVGPDEHANVEYRRSGKKRRAGRSPKEHFELGEAIGQMDFAAAAKMSGLAFTVLKAGLARMERALGQFMLDLHTTEHGYTEVQPPLMVRSDDDVWHRRTAQVRRGPIPGRSGNERDRDGRKNRTQMLDQIKELPTDPLTSHVAISILKAHGPQSKLFQRFVEQRLLLDWGIPFEDSNQRTFEIAWIEGHVP